MNRSPLSHKVRKTHGFLRRRATLYLFIAGMAIVGNVIGSYAEVSPAPAPTRKITDAAGRVVQIPTIITRVATVGAVPVLDSFILALGKGETIVSGLPLFAQSPRHKYLRQFLPQTARQPPVQAGNGEPSIEILLTLRPDVVFVMDPMMAEQLEKRGIPVIVLIWREPADITRTIRLLGEILRLC